MKTTFLIIFIVIGCAWLGALGQIFFKPSSKDFSLSFSGVLKNHKFLIGATLYAISAILFVWTLKFGELSVLYPIIATSYIWVALLSIIFLGESVSATMWVGIGLIISGIWLIIK